MTKSNHLLPTLDDTVGPYFPKRFVEGFRNDLSQYTGMIVRPRGELIRIEGIVRDMAGDPVAPALVEFWQPDTQGRYRTPENSGDVTLDPWFEGFGRQYCDEGRFALTTVRPGAASGRAPHITVTLYCDGITRVVTQLFLPDEPLNQTDPVLGGLPAELAERLVCEEVGSNNDITVYRRDIVMRGDNETPFFDDMES